MAYSILSLIGAIASSFELVSCLRKVGLCSAIYCCENDASRLEIDTHKP